MFINKSQPEIVNAIDKATVYLECWTTEAKAEEAKIVENIELVNLVRAERAKNK